MSIVMPNYNHGPYLHEAIAAIASQSTLPDEVVVVDDGSTDDSVAILQKLATGMPWLHIVRHSENRGVNAACNTGLHVVRGEFVLFSAADDRLDSEMVTRARIAAEVFSQSGILFSDPAEMNSDGTGLRVCPLDLPPFPHHFTPEEMVRLLRRQFFFFSVNNVWFNVPLLQKLGGFPPPLRWHGDLFAAYAAAFDCGATYVPGSISYFRRSDESYSAAGRRGADQLEVLRAWHRKTKEAGYERVRAAFVAAGVLPEYSLRAVGVLRSDLGYLTPRLAVRLLWLIVWPALAAQVGPSWRYRMRNLRSELRRYGWTRRKR
jgi:glycosyltransferase involved in cell wall biosynthesis